MSEKQATFVGLGVILLAGFGLRVTHLLHVSPIGDEYITMLAADSVLRWGYPRLPSGLYYDHGLLFTYSDALFICLFGLDQVVTRVPGLLFGMLALATVYQVGCRWFSPCAGLVATTLMALLPQAIVWGARARMYGLWMWLFLLATFWLASGLLIRDSRLLRCLGIVALIGSVFSHVLTLGFMIPLAAGLVAGWLLLRWNAALPFRLRCTVWPEVGLLAAGVLLLVFCRRLGGHWGIAGRATADPVLLSNPFALLVRILVAIVPFVRPPQLILSLFAVTGVFFLLLRLVRRCPEREDALLACLVVLFGGGVTGVGALSRFYDDRYVFALLPAFVLLVGRELALLGARIGGRNGWLVQTGLPVLLVTGVLGPVAWTTATYDQVGLDCAYAFVRQHWRDDDRVATTIPAAALICLGRSDYYVWEDSGTSTLRVDRWVGTPRYDSPEAFAAVLAVQQRVWFIVDEWFWDHSLSPEFQDLVRTEMVLVFHPTGALVYLHDE